MNLPFKLWIPVGLSIASMLIQLAILGILTRKKLRSDFRAFFTYNISVVLMSVVAVISYVRSCCLGDGYFYLYSTLSTLLTVLEFWVMYEVFVNVVRPYSALIDLGKMLFRWAGVFLLIGATLTAFATMGPQTAKFAAAVTLLERSLRLMQCGLLLLFFAFERKLNLSWRSPSVSIALGLGVSAAFGLILSPLNEHYPAAQFALGIVDSASYVAIVSFWAICLALPQPERKNVLDSPGRLVFQRWNEALMATPIVGQARSKAVGSVESFLPGIEKTVERVLARKAMH